MKINVGALYQAKKCCWLLYPSPAIGKEILMGGGVLSLSYEMNADSDAKYWSRQLSCDVSFLAEGDLFMPLKLFQDHCRVLTTQGQLGWIFLESWPQVIFEEVKAE